MLITCIVCVQFCSCLCKVCSRVSEAFFLALRTLSLITLPQPVRLFCVSFAFSSSPTAVHHALWSYTMGILSEPLLKDSHKQLHLMEKPQYCVLKSLDHILLLRTCTCYGDVYRNIAREEKWLTYMKSR